MICFIDSNAFERRIKVKKIFIIFIFLFRQFELICCLLFLFLQRLKYIKSTSGAGGGTANEKEGTYKNVKQILLSRRERYKKLQKKKSMCKRYPEN
ncbi:hypothetical protein RFI_34883 [Reticulomyxa filosa]|uniref:Uncharacterized protein n=1 Tax=Reticulomyxa filosa TaxID=46433 RepID=X6LP81_RETFI|nr:hypothetical protein RFI_34883 [Reticulomyxa filosa]|eukprot:ETO02545.1 hypothetical protein RFI_34883 [Reticulomyxa filosa]